MPLELRRCADMLWRSRSRIRLPVVSWTCAWISRLSGVVRNIFDTCSWLTGSSRLCCGRSSKLSWKLNSHHPRLILHFFLSMGISLKYSSLALAKSVEHAFKNSTSSYLTLEFPSLNSPIFGWCNAMYSRWVELAKYSQRKSCSCFLQEARKCQSVRCEFYASI